MQHNKTEIDYLANVKELNRKIAAKRIKGDERINAVDTAVEGVESPSPFPGAMEKLVAEALRVAHKPQPELTTLGVLIGMASALDGHFKLPNGSRLNLYGIGVADTGWGKEAPRNVAIAIANICGATVIGKPGSGQGLEDALEDHKNMLVEMDEVAHVMESLNATNRPGYMVELASNLLRLFSSSRTKYNKRRLAAKDSRDSEPLEHPCVNLLGYSTPQKLGEAVSAKNVGDGLMGRLLFVSGRDGVKIRRNSAEFTIPDGLGDVAKMFIDQHTGRSESRYCRIEIDAGADEMLDNLANEFDEQANLSTHSFAKDVMVRSAEKVERIAGVLAAWDNVRRPLIEVEHVVWAEKFVRYSNASILKFVDRHMHGSEVQKNAVLVMDALNKMLNGAASPQRAWEREALEDGDVPKALLLRKLSMETRVLDLALIHLEELGDISVRERHSSDPARKPSKVVRLL